jgi:enhancing lycopene biosynthesis protein 2
MPKLFTTFNALTEAVREARDNAHTEARRDCGKGFFKSRGAWFVTLNAKEGLTMPANENFPCKRITAKELAALITKVQANYPKVDSIDVCGGFDYAENLSEFNSQNYDPWVSEWSVTVWTRSGQQTTQVPVN